MTQYDMTNQAPLTISGVSGKGTRSLAMQLFFLGFSTLLLELIFIRYLAGNIWNMGYFPNLVLLAVFIGMGIGFSINQRLSENRSQQIQAFAWVIIAGLVLFVYYFHPGLPGFGTSGGLLGGEELFFTATPAASNDNAMVPFLVIFAAVISTAAMISQRTGRLFHHFSPLKAYTLDIAGSVAGIVAFMVISFLHIPAWIWFIAAGAAYLPSMPRVLSTRLFVGVLVCLTSLTAWFDDTSVSGKNERPAWPLTVIWSPYQKVEHLDDVDGGGRIYVNGVQHQDLVQNKEGLFRGFYSAPYRERALTPFPQYKNVLIIGAGSGNDVATALLRGAEHVDAVEIDPAIAGFGRDAHPAQPYKDPRVNLVVDDGRAFLQRTQRKYDLIIFALTDSLIKVSGMSQLRLENYLFTVESVRQAFSRLNPGGDIVLYNYYRHEWLVDKITAMCQEATGREPRVIFQARDFVMLAVSQASAQVSFKPNHGIDVPRDDWPFLYLIRREVPQLYLISTFVVGIAVMAVFLMLQLGPRGSLRALSAPGRIPTALAFLLMGTAFLLLETKSIIQFSLLFGTTWINTSLVFLGVLLLVLAANWVAHLLHHRLLPLISAVFLIAACIVTIIYPLGNLLGISSLPLRFIFASLLTFSPIFFANLLFSSIFRDQHDAADQMFGWNLIGAVIGGLLEYRSMALGYQSMGYLVLLCYAAVCLLLVLARKQITTASALTTRV